MPVPVPGRIADLLRRSTVRVIVEEKRHRAGRSAGHGSGVVLHQHGEIVTNAHVAGAGARVRIESWEGRSVEGVVVRVDDRRDLALIAAPGHDVPPLSLGDSNHLKAGTPVIAVGNPFGFTGAASSGVVHGTSNYANGGGGRWIAADLHLAPGNSGGPLANFSGEVVGINTMVVAGLRSPLALAIPSRAVGRFLAGDSGRVLGVTVRPVRLRSGTHRLMLTDVANGGVADCASLMTGDILITANGRTLQWPSDLEEAIAEAPRTMPIQFRRGSAHVVREVVVAWSAKGVPNAA